MSPALPPSGGRGRRQPPRARRAGGPEGLGYVDGVVTDLAKARIPLNDRGYLLGDGVFETLRVVNGAPFRLEEHCKRLRAGLKAIGLEEAVEADFRDAVAALTKAGKRAFGDDLYLRVNVSTGPMDGVANGDRGILVTGLCKRFKPYPMQYYARGIEAIVSRQRKDSRNPLSTVKTLSFLPHVAARREAHSQTVHDALLLNEKGRVAEATTSNVFARKGDKVFAPGVKEGAVQGVTRDVVLELMQDNGIEVVRSLTLPQLRSAQEAWLTNTTGGIVPLTKLQDRPIGRGTKGELTTRLSHAFEALLRSHA